MGRLEHTVGHRDSPSCSTREPPADHRLLTQHPIYPSDEHPLGVVRVRPPADALVDIAFSPSKNLVRKRPGRVCASRVT